MGGAADCAFYRRSVSDWETDTIGTDCAEPKPQKPKRLSLGLGPTSRHMQDLEDMQKPEPVCRFNTSSKSNLILQVDSCDGDWAQAARRRH